MSQSQGKRPKQKLVPNIPSSPRLPENWEIPGGVVFPVVLNVDKTDFLSSFPSFLFCLIPEVHPPNKDNQPIKRRVEHHYDLNDDEIKAYQEQGYGIYFSVNGFKRAQDATNHPLPPQRTTEALTAVTGHYVDIDCPKEWRSLPDKREFFDKLEAFKRDAYSALTNNTHPARQIVPFIPNLIIETRHGLQAVWLFKDPLNLEGATEESLKRLHSLYTENQRALIRLFDGDKQASDLVRVIRFPFTWHLKNPKSPFPCVPILWDLKNEKKPSFKDFCEALKENPMSEKTAEAFDPDGAMKTALTRANQNLKKLTASEHQEVLSEVERAYPKCDRPSIRRLAAGAPEGERNQTLHVIASAWRASGKSEEETFNEFKSYSNLSESETRAVIRSAFARPKEYGWNHPIIAGALSEEERTMYRSFYADIAHEKFGSKYKKLNKLVALDTPEELEATAPTKTEEKKADDAEAVKRRISIKHQKEALVGYHHRMRTLYPDIRYLEGLGPHVKEGNIYKPITDKDLLLHMVSRHFEQDGLVDIQTKAAADRTVFNWMAMPEVNIPTAKIEPLPPASSGKDFLPLQNGILELTKRTLRPFPPDEAWLTISTVPYNPDAVCPRWERFIKEITEEDDLKAKLLQEIAGYCLSSSVKFQKAFIFLGKGNNGKGVFVSALENILGPSLRSALTIEDFQSPFGPAGLEHKRLNVIDEISDNYFRSDFLKRITGGSTLEADVKFKARRQFRPTAKILFTVNQLPRIDDTTYAIYRRLTIIKFNRIFKGREVDAHLQEKLSEEASGILNWCLEGYVRLMMTNEFTHHPEVARSIEEMNESNSYVVRFLLSKDVELATLGSENFTHSTGVEDLYRAYRDYCGKLGGRMKGIVSFQHELSNLSHPALTFVQMSDDRVLGVKLKRSNPADGFGVLPMP